MPDRLDVETGGRPYRVTYGEVTLSGSNPTPIATGLEKVEGCKVTHKTASAPALDPHHFTVDYGGSVPAGQANVYAWKPTSPADNTLVASTNSSAVLTWMAWGTGTS